jgi:plastocyanin
MTFGSPGTPRLLALSLVAAAMLAVGSSDADAELLRVRIDGLVFMPAALTAAPGDIIEWVNEDFVDHTATTRAGGFDVTIPAGAARRLTVSKPGLFDYHCIFHPAMRGSITVR